MFVKNLKMHLHLYFSYTVLYFQSQYFFIKTDNTYFNINDTTYSMWIHFICNTYGQTNQF